MILDLSQYVCPNPSCEFFQRSDEGNLIVRSIFGRHEDILLLHCKACGMNFSENRDTIFSQLKTPRDKVVKVLTCLQQGEGVRATSRITGLHRDTVSRIFRLARSEDFSEVPSLLVDAS